MEYAGLVEGELWRLFKEEGDTEARNEIIRRYYRYVEMIAQITLRQFMRNVMLEDLIALGSLGLIAAVEQFDPKRGVKFKTFMKRRVKGAMIDGMRNEGWFARKARIRRKRIQDAHQRLSKGNKVVVSYEEVAQEAGVSVEEAEWFLNDGYIVLSLDEMSPKCEDGERISIAEMVPDRNSPRPLDIAEKRDLLDVALSGLSEAERKVIEWFYRDGLGIKEIGVRLNATRARVSQLKRDALARARRIVRVGSRAVVKPPRRAAQ